MNIEVELDTYKSLVMLLADEHDDLGKVINRLLKGGVLNQIEDSAPVNQSDPGYWYRGMWHRSKNAIDVYVLFLETLGREFEFFYGMFERQCSALGNTRTYFAKEKELLYTDNRALERYAKPVGDWWADGNISNKQKLDLMHLAAKTAGLQRGVDYKIFLPNAE